MKLIAKFNSQMNVPVHQFLQMASSLVAMSLIMLETLLNTPVEVATIWWVPTLEHVKLVVTGQQGIQYVRKVGLFIEDFLM